MNSASDSLSVMFLCQTDLFHSWGRHLCSSSGRRLCPFGWILTLSLDWIWVQFHFQTGIRSGFRSANLPLAICSFRLGHSQESETKSIAEDTTQIPQIDLLGDARIRITVAITMRLVLRKIHVDSSSRTPSGSSFWCQWACIPEVLHEIKCKVSHEYRNGIFVSLQALPLPKVEISQKCLKWLGMTNAKEDHNQPGHKVVVIIFLSDPCWAQQKRSVCEMYCRWMKVHDRCARIYSQGNEILFNFPPGCYFFTIK